MLNATGYFVFIRPSVISVSVGGASILSSLIAGGRWIRSANQPNPASLPPGGLRSVLVLGLPARSSGRLHLLGFRSIVPVVHKK